MRTLLFGLLLLVPLSMCAQQPAHERISFRLMDKDDGLPYASITHLLQDRSGKLWVGMSLGLAVYDGNQFTSITCGEERAPIRPVQLIEGRDGAIWVASLLGVVRVDPLTWKTRLYDLPDTFDHGIDGMPIMSVALGKGSALLCGTQRGLFHLDTDRGVFTEIRSAGKELMEVDRAGFKPDSALHGFWIGTWNQGLAFYDTLSGTLYEKDGDRSVFPWIGEDLLCMMPDGEGGYWASAHRPRGLWYWDPLQRRTRKWTHLPGNRDLPVDGGMYMTHDRAGNIWGCQWVAGAYRFSTHDSSAISFASLNDEYGTLPLGYFTSMYEAPGGELWFASPAGIAIYDPSQPQVRVIDHAAGSGWMGATPIVSDVLAQGDSTLWCMTQHSGLFRYDLRTDRSVHVDVKDEQGKAATVTGMKLFGGKLYMTTTAGLCTMDHRTLKPSAVRMRDGAGKPLEQTGYGWMQPDATGMLWLYGWNSFTRYDPRTGTATLFKADSANASALPKDKYFCGASTADGKFWVGSEVHGLSYYDPQQNTWTSLNADLEEGRSKARRILDLATTSDDMLWLATDDAGLVRYDKRTRTYTQFDQRHGFTARVIQTIEVDRSGRLWLGTFDGLACFDPRTERATMMKVSSGMLFDELTLGTCMAANGLCYMADRKRVLEFDPNTVTFGRPVPAPTIHRVFIDGEAVPVSDGSIDMGHDKSHLVIRYGAILPPGYIRKYAMRISDGVWSESEEGRVDMRALEPGQYVFGLRLMNAEGTWGPVTTLAVTIDPPWWKTLWARILFGLTLAAIIVVVFRARLNWIRKRERAEEEQARTVNELKLQALRAQMDPHFIFNCLNSIDSFIIANDRQQASHYLGRFAKLIRLILQHSDSTRVTLEREVEMLRYYLELESLRFKIPFRFELNVDPRLEGEPVELPAMLVQPYVENAIWHGLRHKEEQGLLTIDFRLRGDVLECTIEDNGIGREASRLIDQQRSGIHRSMGMRVSADRLRIQGELEHRTAHVSLHDLKDRDGKAIGTRAVISIPIMDDRTEEDSTNRVQAPTARTPVT